jgi:hypothetical protein
VGSFKEDFMKKKSLILGMTVLLAASLIFMACPPEAEEPTKSPAADITKVATVDVGTATTPAANDGSTDAKAIGYSITVPSTKESIVAADIAVSAGATAAAYVGDWTTAATTTNAALTAGTPVPINVIVTAENGSKKYYTLTVTRATTAFTIGFAADVPNTTELKAAVTGAKQVKYSVTGSVSGRTLTIALVDGKLTTAITGGNDASSIVTPTDLKSWTAKYSATAANATTIVVNFSDTTPATGNITDVGIVKNALAALVTADAIEDTTAPTVSAVAVTALTADGGKLGFNTTEAGTYYYLVLPTATATPEAATVKAQGTAPAKGTAVATSGTNSDIAITGLSASTAYKAHVIVEDVAGNKSTVVSSSEFTTEAAITSVITTGTTATTDDDLLTITLTGGTLKSDLYLFSDDATKKALVLTAATTLPSHTVVTGYIHGTVTSGTPFAIGAVKVNGASNGEINAGADLTVTIAADAQATQVTSATAAFSAAPPTITGASYAANTGKLTITGTKLGAAYGDYTVNNAKIGSVALTVAQESSDIVPASTTSVVITVNNAAAINADAKAGVNVAVASNNAGALTFTGALFTGAPQTAVDLAVEGYAELPLGSAVVNGDVVRLTKIGTAGFVYIDVSDNTVWDTGAVTPLTSAFITNHIAGTAGTTTWHTLDAGLLNGDKYVVEIIEAANILTVTTNAFSSVLTLASDDYVRVTDTSDGADKWLASTGLVLPANITAYGGTLSNATTATNVSDGTYIIEKLLTGTYVKASTSGVLNSDVVVTGGVGRITAGAAFGTTTKGLVVYAPAAGGAAACAANPAVITATSGDLTLTGKIDTANQDTTSEAYLFEALAAALVQTVVAQ